MQLYSHVHCTHLSFAHTCTHMPTAPLTAGTYSHIPTAQQRPLHSPNMTCSLYRSHLYRHCIHIHKTAGLCRNVHYHVHCAYVLLVPTCTHMLLHSHTQDCLACAGMCTNMSTVHMCCWHTHALTCSQLPSGLSSLLYSHADCPHLSPA